jgi:anti-anti-sigma regulatory factor
MIIQIKDDLVRLSGALVKNEWLTIKAAANLLLRDHPQGIIIDCSELGPVSEKGAKTFLDAIRDIQAGGSRMYVCGLPEEVLSVVKGVPGLRSQLPIANSLEEARASLKLFGERVMDTGSGAFPKGALLVLLTENVDLDFTAPAAVRVARDLKQPIILLYLMEVSRDLALNTPLPEQEAAARDAIQEVEQHIHRHGQMPVYCHLERVRDAASGALQMIDKFQASNVLISSEARIGPDSRILDLIRTLLERAPCGVLVARNAMNPAEM